MARAINRTPLIIVNIIIIIIISIVVADDDENDEDGDNPRCWQNKKPTLTDTIHYGGNGSPRAACFFISDESTSDDKDFFGD